MQVGINPVFDYLYDPQQVRPVGFCTCCGRELYSFRSETCEHCQMDVDMEVSP